MVIGQIVLCCCLCTEPVQYGHWSDCTFVVACALSQFSMVIGQIVLCYCLWTEPVQYGHWSDCTLLLPVH